TPRGFIVGVQNLAFPSALLPDNGAVSYCLSLDTSLVPSGGKAAKASFSQDMSTSIPVVVTVPPRSIAARTVWIQSFDDKDPSITTGNPTDTRASVRVGISALAAGTT